MMWNLQCNEDLSLLESLQAPIENGIINICFLDLVLQGLLCASFLIFGIIRIFKIRKFYPNSRYQVRSFSKLFLSKLGASFTISLIPIFRTLIQLLLNEFIPLSEILAGIYLPISWLLSSYILLKEHDKSMKTSWTLKLWWISSFLLSSLTLQSNWEISRKTQVGFGVDFVAALINFLLQTFLTVTGLFFDSNSTHNAFQRLVNRKKESKGLIDEEEERIERQILPIIYANWFSKLFWSWFTPLLKLGYQKPLDADDLYILPPSQQTDVMAEVFREHWEKEKKKKNPTILIALFKSFGKQWLWSGLMKLISDMSALIGPIMLQNLIIFVKDPSQPWYMGILYTLGMLVSNAAKSFFMHHWYYNGLDVGMKARGSISTAIYVKSFRLSPEGRRATTVGELVNLQAIDAQRVQELCSHLHIIWAAPLQLAVCIYFIWKLIGPAVLAGIGVAIFISPAAGIITKKLLKYQRTVMGIRDQRTKVMNEILNGIRVIKFFTWEKPFSEKVEAVRKEELEEQKRIFTVTAIATFCWSITPVSIAVTSFSVYASYGNHELSPQLVFTALALFEILKEPLMMIPAISSYLIEFTTSMRRINKFLLSPEIDPNAVIYGRPQDSPNAVELNKAVFQWDPKMSNPTLEIDLQFQKGKLIVVVGAVGAGKTSLLSAILGQIPKISGDVKVFGSTAYVAQTAWIQNATVRQNVIFGSAFDAEKYEKVIKACELSQDMKIFPNGDLTEIGEKGINISGGQKQRVALARAAYKFDESDIFLLDDCLSAVDAHVGKNIFNHCISQLMNGKTRILCTHQLQFASQADLIVVIDQGRVTEVGTYEELMTKQSYFHTLITTHVQSKKEEENQEKSETIGESKEPNKSEKEGKLMSNEDREIGNVSMSIWKEYIMAAGGLLLVIIAFLFFSSEASTRLGTDFWLSKWSNAYQNISQGQPIDRHTLNLGFYIGIYILLSTSSSFFSMFRTLLLLFGSLKASRTLHAQVLLKIFRAPMSYFDTTPMGRILNRFSNDIYRLDSQLANPITEFLTSLFRGINVVFVIGLTTPFLLTMFLPLLYLYRYLHLLFSRTVRELKRLESISKSPVLAHFSETLNGIATINAFRRQKEFTANQNKKQDRNLEAWWALILSNRWLSFRIEVLAATVVAAVSGFIAIARNNYDPSFVGIAILYSLQLSSVMTWLIRWGTEMENQMVSAERIIQLSKIESEAAYEIPDEKIPKSWPSEGRIEVRDAKLRYRPELDLALRGVSFEIKPREKVGVVGRTGAGKSSVMMALFRLVELSEGSVIIDGIDVSKIGLKTLRSKLSIIPQDPTLFTGTIRSNLDQFGNHSDYDIWQVLERINMKELVDSLPEKLENPVAEYGSNLSSGQQQLLCLGRALLKKAAILLMDEATAAVDYETDHLIQKTIRKEFADVTVITIAHRINTIMDYDRVLVLDKGKVAEYDTPANLLKLPHGIFASLASKAGTNMINQQWN